MVKESIFTRMAHAMKASGRTIYSMEEAKKYGQMARDIKENIGLERNKGLDRMNGPMDQNMKVHG